jgi:prepilin-type N-terminal cleavage/methylation domain-containing protein
MAIVFNRRPRGSSRRGFTIIEVLIAMVVLTLGILSVATVFSSSLMVIKYSEEDTIARQEAQQMIEGIFAGRNSGALSFSAIQNQSVDPVNGVFKDGFTPALQAGPDGIMNTLDDLPLPALDTGPDGKPLSNFQRQIQISQVFLQDGVTVDPSTRKIQIWVQYQVGGLVRTYTQVTYISNYR